MLNLQIFEVLRPTRRVHPLNALKLGEAAIIRSERAVYFQSECQKCFSFCSSGQCALDQKSIRVHVVKKKESVIWIEQKTNNRVKVCGQVNAYAKVSFTCFHGFGGWHKIPMYMSRHYTFPKLCEPGSCFESERFN